MSTSKMSHRQVSQGKIAPLISQMVLTVLLLVYLALAATSLDLSGTFTKVIMIALPVLVSLAGLAAMLQSSVSTVWKAVFGLGTLAFLGGLTSFLLPLPPTTINLAGGGVMIVGLVAAFGAGMVAAIRK